MTELADSDYHLPSSLFQILHKYKCSRKQYQGILFPTYTTFETKRLS